MTELRGSPSTRADTCTCGCALTTPPSCTRGATGASYDNNNSDTCNQQSSYAWNPGANGACSTDMWPGPWTTNHDWKFAVPARTGGACTAAPEKHVERLDFADVARRTRVRADGGMRRCSRDRGTRAAMRHLCR